jgi:hypothetical protein
MPKYESLARSFARKKDSPGVVVLAVPPFDQAVLSNSRNVLVGKFDADRKWFVKTPAVFGLNNGVVVPERNNVF